MTEARFTIGARVACTDGTCGKVTRIIVNPVTHALTHLVVEHWYEHDRARLVPAELAEAVPDGVALKCTRERFESLPPAEERDFVAGTEHPGYESGQVLSHPYFSLGGAGVFGGGMAADMAGGWTEGQGWDPGGSHGTRRRTFTYDSVPAGEVQVRRGNRVHATDSEIGHVEGLVVDPANNQVTHVLLQQGHLWGHRDVAIPISAVTSIDGGVRLSLSKQQVEDLPQVDIDHPASQA